MHRRILFYNITLFVTPFLNNSAHCAYYFTLTLVKDLFLLNEYIHFRSHPTRRLDPGRRPVAREPAAVLADRGQLHRHDGSVHGLDDDPVEHHGPATDVGLHAAGPHRQAGAQRGADERTSKRQ